MPVIGSNDEDMTRLLRATWAAVAFAQLHAPASSEDDFARIAVGRCAALDEGLRTALFVRPLLGSAWRAEYAHMARLLAAAPDCRLAAMRSRWATPDDLQARRPDETGPPKTGPRGFPRAFVRCGVRVARHSMGPAGRLAGRVGS